MIFTRGQLGKFKDGRIQEEGKAQICVQPITLLCRNIGSSYFNSLEDCLQPAGHFGNLEGVPLVSLLTVHVPLVFSDYAFKQKSGIYF